MRSDTLSNAVNRFVVVLAIGAFYAERPSCRVARRKRIFEVAVARIIVISYAFDRITVLFESRMLHRVAFDETYQPSRPKLICKLQHWRVRRWRRMLAWSGYCDRRQESDRRADALRAPQRCTNRRVNGESSQHLFLPWRCMRALSCGPRSRSRNRRSKPPRQFSSIRWRKSLKRALAPVRPALPKQEPRPIDTSVRNGICRRNPAERSVLKLWFLRNPIILESLLFGSGSYQDAPISKHAILPLKQTHFERWVTLFAGTSTRTSRDQGAGKQQAAPCALPTRFRVAWAC
jgi:hypothetical protein